MDTVLVLLQKLRGNLSILQWCKTETAQGSWSKELRRNTNLNCSPIRIAPVTFPKGFSVSKALLDHWGFQAAQVTTHMSSKF